nr:immunoglobulin heavy chain junction region [Mus musculus]MBK4185131.1 immunoglobulin heavy chain junction region [Mus musculus]
CARSGRYDGRDFDYW